MKKLLLPIIRKRAETVAKLFIDQVDSSKKVLDIGAGNMLVSQYIKEKKNLDIEGVDVLDMNLTNLKHTTFDGNKLPFEDKSFDNSHIIFVLHHTNNQEQILEEAKRVTKDKIIILEDTFKNKPEEIFLKVSDVLGNVIEEPKMKFALKFRKEEDWEKLFKKLDLKIKYKITIFNKRRLCHHSLFVLNIK